MSNNFEVIKNYDDWKVIRTSCECMNDDHILGVEIEQDEDFGVNLIFNYSMPSKDILNASKPPRLFINSTDSKITRYWKTLKFEVAYKFNQIWGRLKLIGKVIFNRPITFEEAFIFRDKEHVDELCDYIKDTAEEVYRR